MRGLTPYISPSQVRYVMSGKDLGQNWRRYNGIILYILHVFFVLCIFTCFMILVFLFIYKYVIFSCMKSFSLPWLHDLWHLICKYLHLFFFSDVEAQLQWFPQGYLIDQSKILNLWERKYILLYCWITCHQSWIRPVRLWLINMTGLWRKCIFV